MRTAYLNIQPSGADKKYKYVGNRICLCKIMKVPLILLMLQGLLCYQIDSDSEPIADDDEVSNPKRTECKLVSSCVFSNVTVKTVFQYADQRTVDQTTEDEFCDTSEKWLKAAENFCKQLRSGVISTSVLTVIIIIFLFIQ